MTAALLMLIVGSGDIARAALGRRAAAAAIVALVPLLAGGAAAVLGVAIPAAALAAVAAAGWFISTWGARGSARIWPVAALGVALAAGAMADPWAVDESAPLASFLAGAGPAPAAQVVAAVAAGVALTATGNRIARAVLVRARERDAGEETPGGWRLSLGGRVVGDVQHRPSSVGASGMRGGRIIGPLERILVAALALLGAQTVLAALLAAKGIVRFPEISADRGTGSKAEEFLVGSLVSWATAGAAALFVVAHG